MKMRTNFSILTLLLFVSLAGVLSAWWMERNRVIETIATLEQKQKRLERYEGHLDISDPSKAHAMGFFELIRPRMRWKWRVYLPPDKKYRLHWTDFDIPADGKIKAEHNEPGRTYGGTTEYSGEFLVEFSVHKARNGDWEMVMAANDQGVCRGMINEDEEIPMNFSDRYSVLPKHGTRVMERDVLLLHAMYPEAERKRKPSNTREGCAEGFAVWFEEITEADTTPSIEASPAN